MKNKRLNLQDLNRFRNYLTQEEKSAATVEKYLRDTRAFFAFTGEKEVTKGQVLAWKELLVEKGYAVRSINSMLASLNSLFSFLGLDNCKVKSLKTQRQTYCAEEKQLTKEEYMRLLNAAKDQPQLRMVMETICGTGIRVSELQYFTVEAVEKGQVEIHCKGKIRTILIPGKLRKLLQKYIKRNSVRNGAVFITRSGRPLNRSNIWARMKRLCGKAGVEASKVFPHNLRKLFARAFYRLEKDIAKLADILGHSSIGTTRIYIMTTGSEHRRQLDRLGLVV
ncbi:site-specific integrase [bacterium 210820-DFI.6.37]|nr:site-specific integrase [bacterium 210820-DFI.6.37]